MNRISMAMIASLLSISGLLATSHEANAVTYTGTATISATRHYCSGERTSDCYLAYSIDATAAVQVDFQWSLPELTPMCDYNSVPDGRVDVIHARTISDVTWTNHLTGDTESGQLSFGFEDRRESDDCYEVCSGLHTTAWSLAACTGFGNTDYWVSIDGNQVSIHLSLVDSSTLLRDGATVNFTGTAVLPDPGGSSWDGVSLQEILDAEYGPGAIDVPTAYEGYLPGDADPGYWEDFGVETALIREIAGFEDANVLGWYAETLSGPPTIDGTDDGVIFEGPVSDGAEVIVRFKDETRFGFYMNPNGTDSSNNAPEPELFFTNRYYNDIGPDGSGALHAPFDGDVQCLIFNISHLRGGVPTFVLAWEDLDSGAEVTESWSPTGTDNDFNDLVVEVSAYSPVKVESSSWTRVKAMFGEQQNEP